MKSFLILSIICSLGVSTILARPNREDKEKQIARACGEENNLDGERFLKYIQSYTEDEQMCMIACLARKFAADELIGSSNKGTISNGFMKVIDEAYKGGFENEEFTRKDVVNKVEDCYATEPTECGFFKCVYTNEPFIQVYLYFENNLHLRDTLFNYN